MEKKNLALILSILCIIISIGIIYFSVRNVEFNTKYFKEITYKETKKLFDDNKSFILYVGSAKCSHCKEFSPKFKKVLDENKVYAYYLDLNELSTEEAIDFENYISISGTPTVVFIVDGEEESTMNRIRSSAVSKDYIYDKLKVNGYIKEK
jgi:predicted bacteriocin transport accessory protein